MAYVTLMSFIFLEIFMMNICLFICLIIKRKQIISYIFEIEKIDKCKMKNYYKLF